MHSSEVPATRLHAPLALAYGTAWRGGPSVFACPTCGERNLVQVHRRSIDRFWSRYGALRRFHCQQFRCQWQGNLSKGKGEVLDSIPKNARLPLLMYGVVALMVCTAAWIVLQFLGWFPDLSQG